MNLLAHKKYETLADLTALGPEHLQAADIRRAIEAYPGTVRLPDENELIFDVVEVDGSSPRQFCVDVPVFTVEEGRSDLTVRMTVIERPGADYDVVFYDAWVM